MLQVPSPKRTHEIFNIAEIEPHIGPNDWIIWDIDNTILETTQILGSDQWFTYFLGKKQAEGLSASEAVLEALKVYVSVQNTTKVRPVESDVLERIRRHQAQGNTVILLTSRGDYLEQATHNQMNDLDLSFNHGVFQDQVFTLEAGTEKKLSKGVIFCSGGRNKGDCLEVVLNRLDTRPEKIVFIDDKLSYIDTVEKMADKLGIAFVGLRYGYLDEKVAQLNVKIAAQQLEKFEHPILSDEEAHILHRAKHLPKLSVHLNQEKDYALVYGLGYKNYEAMMGLELSEQLKLHRKKPKFLELDGHQELCFRFKFPFALLQEILPRLYQENLLSEKETSELQSQLSELLNPAPQSAQILTFQYKAVTATSLNEREDPESSQALAVKKASNKL